MRFQYVGILSTNSIVSQAIKLKVPKLQDSRIPGYKFYKLSSSCFVAGALEVYLRRRPFFISSNSQRHLCLVNTVVDEHVLQMLG